VHGAAAVRVAPGGGGPDAGAAPATRLTSGRGAGIVSRSAWSNQRQEDVAVTVRSRSLLAAALGLCMAHPLFGQEPARLPVEPAPQVAPQTAPSVNQQVANTIADRLRQSGQLRRYDVDVRFQDGTAELRGTVTDQPQREEVLRLVQGTPGVERVVDRLAPAAAEISQTQAAGPSLSETPAAPPVPAPAAPAPAAPAPPAPLAFGQPAEPLPVFAAPQPGPYDCLDPKMPPYAWPTYAPYNNLSRVAYPLAYPYNAWPFIGPIYPFPKPPLSWRAVTLHWQDGGWLFSKVDNKCDWWRLHFGYETRPFWPWTPCP
jgi:hypothetical protein